MNASVTGKKALWAILLVAAAVKLLLAQAIPMTSDEGLHWMQGRHLAWGFSDHPPGTAALNGFFGLFFGSSWLSVRVFPVLGTLLCSWIAYGILREVGADERRAALGAVIVQLLPMVSFGVVMVPAVPHAVLVFAAQYFLIRALRRGRLLDHALWGLLLGASMLTYYIAAAAILAGILFVAVDPRGRRALKDPRFWVGTVIAATVFAPNLMWNLDQGSQSAVHFQILERNTKGSTLLYPAAFLGLSLVLAGPLLIPALFRAVRAPRAGVGSDEDWRPFFAAFLLFMMGLFFLVSLVTKTGAHWGVVALLNVPLYLFAPQSPPLARGWVRAAVIYPCILAVIIVGVIFAGLDRVSGAVTANIPKFKLYKRDRVLHIADAAVAAHHHAAALEREGRTIRLASDRWSIGGLLSFHTPGNPYYAIYPAPSGHGKDYAGWNPKEEGPIDLVYVATNPKIRDAVRDASASVELIETIGRKADFAWIYLCTGYRHPSPSAMERKEER